MVRSCGALRRQSPGRNDEKFDDGTIAPEFQLGVVVIDWMSAQSAIANNRGWCCPNVP
jgi:hypothetical protein